MNLGEQIYRLRTERNLSQGDLADALDVSRQSVSKWETNSSVPDLDKLVRLSELFGVSLDELVLDRRAEQEGKKDPEPAPSQEPAAGIRPRQVVGTVLLCMALVVAVLCALLGGLLEGLVLAIPFVVCGGICFIARKHPALWCVWAVYLMVELYLRWGTGISWSLIMLTPQFTPEMNYARLAVAWGMTLIPLALAGVTVWTFRGRQLEATAKNRNLLLSGWVLCVVLRWAVRLIPVSFWLGLDGINYFFVALVRWSIDLGWLALLTVLLIQTAALLRGRRQKKG